MIEAGKRAVQAGDTDSANEIAEALAAMEQGGQSQGPAPGSAPAQPPEPRQKNPGIIESIAQGADNFGRGLTRLPGAISDSVQRTAQDFGRGVDRIASGDVSPQQAADALGGSVNTMIHAVPGADLVSAGAENAVNALQGEPMNASAVDEARARQEERAKEYPLQNLAGELTGAGAVASRVAQIPGLAVVAGGGRAANATRLAGQGALGAGGVELAESGDPLKAAGAAATGAVLTPAMSATIERALRGMEVLGRNASKIPGVKEAFAAAAKGGQKAAQAGQGVPGMDLVGQLSSYVERISSKANVPQGIRKLNDVLKQAPQELERVRQAASQAAGAELSWAEILDEDTLRRLEPILKTQQTVRDAGIAAAETAETAIPQRLQRNIQGQNPPVSVEQQQNVLKAGMTRIMDTFRHDPIPINAPRGGRPAFDMTVFDDEDLLSMLNRRQRRQVARIRDNTEPLTVDFLEGVRQTLSGAGSTPADQALGRDLAQRIRGMTEGVEPRYGQAMGLYDEQAAFIQGAGEGAKIRTANNQDFTQGFNSRTSGNPQRQAEGRTAGSRTQLADEAGEDIAGAVRVADDLTTPGLQGRVAATQGAPEAARLAEAGAVEGRAARNLSRFDTRPPSQPTANEDLELGISGLAAAVGKAGVGFKTGAVLDIVRRIKGWGLSRTAAEGLADALFNPSRAREVGRILSRIGKTQEARELVANATATAIIASSPARGE